MDCNLRSLGYVNGPQIRDFEIRHCRSSAFEESAVLPENTEQYNFVHCLSLQLNDIRLNCIDIKNSYDVVYAAENSNIVQVWSTNYPEKVPSAQKIHFWPGRINAVIKNTDFAQVKELVHRSAVKTVSFMEKRILFSGCIDGSVRMYDSVYELMDTWMGNTKDITDIHHNLHFDNFAVSGETSFESSRNGCLYGAILFSFYRKDPIYKCFMHREPTETIRFNSTANMIATADREGKIHIIDPNTTHPVRTFHSGSTLEKKRVEFSPDNRFLAAKDIGVVNIFEIGSGKKYTEMVSSARAKEDFDFGFCGFGNNITLGGVDGILRSWNFTARRSQQVRGDFYVGGPIRRFLGAKGFFSYCVI